MGGITAHQHRLCWRADWRHHLWPIGRSHWPLQEHVSVRNPHYHRRYVCAASGLAPETRDALDAKHPPPSHAGIISAFSVNFPMLVVLRVFVGIGIGGLAVPFDILAEFMPSEIRGKALMGIEYFWCVSIAHVQEAYGWARGRHRAMRVSDREGLWLRDTAHDVGRECVSTECSPRSNNKTYCGAEGGCWFLSPLHRSSGAGGGSSARSRGMAKRCWSEWEGSLGCTTLQTSPGYVYPFPHPFLLLPLLSRGLLEPG